MGPLADSGAKSLKEPQVSRRLACGREEVLTPFPRLVIRVNVEGG
jgi:hypothetical protein